MGHKYGRIGTIRRIRNFETLTILRVKRITTIKRSAIEIRLKEELENELPELK